MGVKLNTGGILGGDQSATRPIIYAAPEFYPETMQVKIASDDVTEAANGVTLAIPEADLAARLTEALGEDAAQIAAGIAAGTYPEPFTLERGKALALAAQYDADLSRDDNLGISVTLYNDTPEGTKTYYHDHTDGGFVTHEDGGTSRIDIKPTDDDARVVLVRASPCPYPLRVFAVNDNAVNGGELLTKLGDVAAPGDTDFCRAALEFRLSGLEGIPVRIFSPSRVLYCKAEGAWLVQTLVVGVPSTSSNNQQSLWQ